MDWNMIMALVAMFFSGMGFGAFIANWLSNKEIEYLEKKIKNL